MATMFIFILCCLRPRGGPNSIGAFKNIGQLRPVSIESSNHYSQFANEDYAQGHMPDHMMQEQDHEQAKQKYMHDFDQDNRALGVVRHSWSPQHGEWVSCVCVCMCVCVCVAEMCACVCM